MSRPEHLTPRANLEDTQQIRRNFVQLSTDLDVLARVRLLTFWAGLPSGEAATELSSILPREMISKPAEFRRRVEDIEQKGRANRDRSRLSDEDYHQLCHLKVMEEYRLTYKHFLDMRPDLRAADRSFSRLLLHEHQKEKSNRPDSNDASSPGSSPAMADTGFEALQTIRQDTNPVVKKQELCAVIGYLGTLLQVIDVIRHQRRFPVPGFG